MNHFTLPDNHQEESDASHFPGLVEKTAIVKIKNKCISKPQRNKILIIGDSHARGCAAELSSSLNTTFEVMGAVMPGSRLEHIMDLARREISYLHHNDFVITWGGANVINRNESNTGLRHIRKFALRNKQTNIIAITPPHRYDLQDSSCVNKEIQVFNRKLHKLLKDMHHVSITDTDLTRNEFTRHRLHMNSSGKEKTAKIIGHNITNLLTSQKPPISLKQKEVPLATSTDETKMEFITGNADDMQKMQLGHHADKENSDN